MSKAVLPENTLEFLKAALKDNLDDFSIFIHSGNEKGNGFLGEMVYLSLKNKQTHEEKYYVLKQILQSNGPSAPLLKGSFNNEVHFYKHIWKSFQDFKNNIPSLKSFEKLARCWTADSSEGTEKLLFENIQILGFKGVPKTKPLDKQHVEMVFDTYGKYHGISFAFRELHSEENAKLVEGLVSLYEILIKVGLMSGLPHLFQAYLKSRNIVDPKLQEHCRRYAENGVQIFADCAKYKGNNAIILHGDCWSNNMMFKYNEAGVPIDIRLIDFQLSGNATPVYDLSYFVYSSTSKEVFDNLDDYLKIYHDSLSRTLQEFGCDSEKVYSFEALKSEWKQYAKFGIQLGLLGLTFKLAKDEDIKSFDEYNTDTVDAEGKTLLQQAHVKNIDNPAYMEIFESMLQHTLEYGCL